MPENISKRIFNWDTGQWEDDYNFSDPNMSTSPISVTWNAPFNPSFAGNSTLGQFLGSQNEQNRLGFLRRYGQIDKDQYDAAMAGQSAIENQALGTGALSLFNLGVNMAGNLRNASKIQDTGTIESQINGIGKLGSGQYSDFSQIQNDYDMANNIRLKSQKDIYGRDFEQDLAGVGASTLQGAVTGMKTFGPEYGWALGLVTGGLDAYKRYQAWQNAGEQKDYLGNSLNLAQATQQRNSQAGMENLMNYNNSQKAARAFASGGKVQRQNLTATEFADLVLGRRSINDVTRSAGMRKQKVDGGLKISFKVK